MHNVTETLNKFKPFCDAEKLYQTNHIFKSIVIELSTGGSYESNIVKLLGIIQMQAKVNENLVNKTPMEIMLMDEPPLTLADRMKHRIK